MGHRRGQKLGEGDRWGGDPEKLGTPGVAVPGSPGEGHQGGGSRETVQAPENRAMSKSPRIVYTS